MKISWKSIKRLFRKEHTQAEAAPESRYTNPLPDPQQEKEVWDSFDNEVNKGDDFWNDNWDAIQRQRKRRTVVLRLKQVAAAAVTAGMLLGAYYWSGIGHRQHTPPAITQLQYKTITNTSADAMDVALEDSTLVTLFPSSVLRYAPAFPDHKRSIYLDGTALFKVARDEARPFTVYGNNIATTALGTIFKVAATGSDSKTKIYLYEGKVVVRSADTLAAKFRRDYYLAPGDVFSYDRSNSMIAVTGSREKARDKAGSKAANDNSTAAVSNWYMFENQELAQVFDQLSVIYNVSIHYDPADLKGLNFIGKIERTDSLGNILKDITLLNNLTLVHNGKNYRIKKK